MCVLRNEKKVFFSVNTTTIFYVEFPLTNWSLNKMTNILQQHFQMYFLKGTISWESSRHPIMCQFWIQCLSARLSHIFRLLTGLALNYPMSKTFHKWWLAFPNVMQYYCPFCFNFHRTVVLWMWKGVTWTMCLSFNNLMSKISGASFTKLKRMLKSLEIRAWISNYITQKGDFMITYPWPNLTHWHINASVILPSLVQIMVCGLVGAKPLSEPLLEYW